MTKSELKSSNCRNACSEIFIVLTLICLTEHYLFKIWASELAFIHSFIQIAPISANIRRRMETPMKNFSLTSLES